LAKPSFELNIDRFRLVPIDPIRALAVGFHPPPREGLPGPYKASIAVRSKKN
jgi:hypothetical protein